MKNRIPSVTTWLIVAIGINVFCVHSLFAGGWYKVDKEFSIISGEVDVMARHMVPRKLQDEGPEEAPVSPYNFKIAVSTKNALYAFSSLVTGANLDEAASSIQQKIGWKSGYLFVSYECGGGNAWRCNGWHVFTVGGERLTHVGRIAMLLHPLQTGQEPEFGYDRGLFYDLYDRLEINDFLSHARAPGFIVVMREMDGRFVVDVELTWGENTKRYNDNIKQIDLLMNMPAEKEQIIPPIVFNAALAKYCDRRTNCIDSSVMQDVFLTRSDSNFFDSLMSKVESGQVPCRYRYEILGE